MPNDPHPANKSKTREPGTASPKLEKTASLTRSIVGRNPLRGTSKVMPLAVPVMTLMRPK